MTIMLGCRPFHNYWQINPNPGGTFPLLWLTRSYPSLKRS